jgi:3-hydroxyisobutyrate dehydrogenase-like beta-hydroxyacid dehydrogenase
MQDTVGLIGIGLVGTALAERLLRAGHRVVGFDIEAVKVAALEALGGSGAASAAEVIEASRRVFLSLPDSSVSERILDEIAPVLASASIVIDTTTGEPDQMAGFGRRLDALGAEFLDATIGGSSEQVRRGEVLVICGGERRTFVACQDLLGTFAQRIFHVGGWGSGARMKLVFNLVLGLNRAVLAEGLGYAEACGIDPAEALEVLKAGPAWSRVMDVKGHKMLERDFTPQARLSQHLKDVKLILKTGRRNHAKLPLSRVHARLLEELESAGFGDADNSAIVQAFRNDPKEERL